LGTWLTWIQNRRYWDTTESGAYIVPSRTSILETLPKIVNSPPKLKPKSTIGTFENIIFQIRNFGTYHPFLTVGVLILAVAALVVILKNGMQKGFGRSTSGFFRLDGKEGLLGNTLGAKAD
jgi:protein disulfide-isomerase